MLTMMKIKTYKPGQIVTIKGHKYRIKRNYVNRLGCLTNCQAYYPRYVCDWCSSHLEADCYLQLVKLKSSDNGKS